MPEPPVGAHDLLMRQGPPQEGVDPVVPAREAAVVPLAPLAAR